MTIKSKILKTTPTQLVVHPSISNKSRAIVSYGPLRLQAAIGRNGRTGLKREDDGKTPIASMRLLYGFYKNRTLRSVKSGLALRRIRSDMLWCDAPENPNYNKLVRTPLKDSHEIMMRTDSLYNICIVLDWNITSRKKNCGSAIFLHLIKPGYQPTAGCVALHERDMKRLLPFLSTKTTLKVC